MEGFVQRFIMTVRTTKVWESHPVSKLLTETTKKGSFQTKENQCYNLKKNPKKLKTSSELTR